MRHVITKSAEMQEKISYLRLHGSNEMQGYYFSNPVSVEVFEKPMRYDSCKMPALGVQHDM